jgi:hypothetical protein
MNLSSTLYTSSLTISYVWVGQLNVKGNESFHSPRGSRRMNDRIMDDRLVQISAVQTRTHERAKAGPGGGH